MDDSVKTRRYRSPARQAAAQQTRRAILAAARRLFIERGYNATTMAAVAEAAGVALDTVYASIGPKPVLFRLLVESAISGKDEAVPALDRDYVRAMQAEPDARRKLALYAQAVRQIQERLAPLFNVLQEAASSDAELAAVWNDIGERRARNMRLLVADLVKTAELRPDLSEQEAADILWTMNSSEFYALMVHQRQWDPSRFEDWLASAWARLLLGDD